MSKLYVVATPIGNLGDFSTRAREILSECGLIAAEDTRHTLKLLNHFGIKTPLTSYHKFNEKSKSGVIIARMLSEELDVALVTDAGTPCISDPGHELVAMARANNIPVYSVAGPSAITAALSVCGYEVGSFAFFGFLPRDKQPLRDALMRIEASPVDAIVLYESPRRVIKTAETLYEAFGDAECCFCCELTKLHEKFFRGPLPEVLATLRNDPYAGTGEYCIVLKKVRKEEKIAQSITLTPEAQIVQEMTARGISLREACEYLKAESALSRNQIYKAGIALRSLIAGEEDGGINGTDDMVPRLPGE